jgi:hypothetical protein
MEKKKIASNIKPVSNTIRSTIHTSDTNQEMLLDEFDVKIIKKATQKAVMGNANLQYHLGVIYYNG